MQVVCHWKYSPQTDNQWTIRSNPFCDSSQLQYASIARHGGYKLIFVKFHGGAAIVSALN